MNAHGSCLMVHITERQVQDLEQQFATLTDMGWVIPPWLVMLRAACQPHEQQTSRQHNSSPRE